MSLRLSLIIPTLNRGAYLAELLASLEKEGDPNLEVLVADGGSTDDTAEVLRRFDRLVTWSVSEPDRGQAHAINKGLDHMSGDVWAYHNSDDQLQPGALARVRAAFADPAVAWIGGSAKVADNSGVTGQIVPASVDAPVDYLRPWARASKYVFAFSGSTYMRREVVEKIGPFDEDFHFSFDIEHYVRAIFEGGYTMTLLPKVLATWVWHPAAKTSTTGLAFGFREDEVRIAERYQHHLPLAQQDCLREDLIFEKRQLVARKACHLASRGHGRQARALLADAVRRDPGLWRFRPWWGAWRRVWGRQKLKC